MTTTTTIVALALAFAMKTNETTRLLVSADKNINQISAKVESWPHLKLRLYTTLKPASQPTERALSHRLFSL